MPFATQQVVDAGDIAVHALRHRQGDDRQIEEQASALIADGARLITIGGDHTIAYPLLRAHNTIHGPVALVHFDAHLDTWDTYFDAPLTHGTPFRRAAEEGLFISGAQRPRRDPRIAVLARRSLVGCRTRFHRRALPRVPTRTRRRRG